MSLSICILCISVYKCESHHSREPSERETKQMKTQILRVLHAESSATDVRQIRDGRFGFVSDKTVAK